MERIPAFDNVNPDIFDSMLHENFDVNLLMQSDDEEPPIDFTLVNNLPSILQQPQQHIFQPIPFASRC